MTADDVPGEGVRLKSFMFLDDTGPYPCGFPPPALRVAARADRRFGRLETTPRWA